MSNFEIKSYKFSEDAVKALASTDKHEDNWPVVYQISNRGDIYIGETTNLKARMKQHLDNPEKDSLNNGTFNVVFDDTFNKSVALDLESFLIQYFSGDGKFNVLNRNDGLRDRDYYDRKNYQKTFEKIWNRLRELRVADKTIAEINNSELFKFSPYKNLSFEQLDVVTKILQDVDQAILTNKKSLSIIDGDAGTGKTIVLMYLAKLLVDLQNFDNTKEDIDDESNFGTFFEQETINQRFKNKKIALVIPQTSLRGRVELICKKSGFGNTVQVFSPIAFGAQDKKFNITLIDEAHLLKIGGYNLQGTALKMVKEINRKLFGDSKLHTELDWIMAKSQSVVMVFSNQQRVRPGNISEKDDVMRYYHKLDGTRYYLHDQRRSMGGREFIDYINCIFSNSFHPPHKESFRGFEAKLFADFKTFRDEILKRDDECGLSRMVAGFAWKWRTKREDYDTTDDIVIDGIGLKWNSTLNNWLGSKRSREEIGSIYTIQGDDLNYVGVIIGKDLIRRKGKLMFNKAAYADSGAMRRNSRQVQNNEAISDEELLNQVLRIYRVLISRAIKGVYLYVCDDELRRYLAKYFDVVE